MTGNFFEFCEPLIGGPRRPNIDLCAWPNVG
jgi:hypothetical protein